MAEEKTKTTKRSSKSAADKASDSIGAAIKALEGESGDVWPVIIARLTALRDLVEKHK